MKKINKFIRIGAFLFTIGFIFNQFFGINIMYAGILYLISCVFMGLGIGSIIKKENNKKEI